MWAECAFQRVWLDDCGFSMRVRDIIRPRMGSDRSFMTTGIVSGFCYSCPSATEQGRTLRLGWSFRCAKRLPQEPSSIGFLGGVWSDFMKNMPAESRYTALLADIGRLYEGAQQVLVEEEPLAKPPRSPRIRIRHF